MPTEADRIVGMIREAIERVRYDATVLAGRRDCAGHLRRGSRPATSSVQRREDQKHLPVSHTPGLEDFAVAQAAYDRACRRWPKEVVTLRQGARLIQESRRSK